MKNIVNIINFVRGIEPRPMNVDLHFTTQQQIDLLKKYNLKGTFLLQYDALLDQRFVDMMSSCAHLCEMGLWLETVQPQVEAVGEEWHGRYAWDWHNDVGYLVGYPPAVREKLIDEVMRLFYATFGYYPKSVGAWHIDAHSLGYMQKKYNIQSACICRDQVGTDGYTIQGGYYNQAYYPSKYNSFCPANSKDNQIDIPVFRMLGSCPIYAYDYQIKPYGVPSIPTMEPAWAQEHDGFTPWFFEEVFDGSGIAFQYTQIGQENSFGWNYMKHELPLQFQMVRQLADEGKLVVETLGESGAWYKQNFDMTPASTITAKTDWWANRKSVWYSNRFYRANLFVENNQLSIRDMYIFRDTYQEPHLTSRCTTHACEYRNLPVFDGAIYNGTIYFADGENKLTFTEYTYKEQGETVVYTAKGDKGTVTVTLSETEIDIQSDIANLCLQPQYDAVRAKGAFDIEKEFANGKDDRGVTSVSALQVRENQMQFTFDGINYALTFTKGTPKSNYSIQSGNGDIHVLCR